MEIKTECDEMNAWEIRIREERVQRTSMKVKLVLRSH
jgi:hypothetical protein